MGFIEDIDKGLQKMGKKINQPEDKKYIRTDCPRCGKQDIKIFKMRARHGYARCPECGEQLVVMMKRS